MNYVIAVLADRLRAEAASADLKGEGIPPEQIYILGQGYDIPEEFSFVNPKQTAWKRAKRMAVWLVPFGFIGGWLFNVSTQYQLVPEVGVIGNHVIGGLLGAIGGAMGSFFVGGGIGLSFGGNDSLPYPKYIKEGKYLVVVGGAPNITNKATRILRQLAPENLQGYIDPTKV